MTVRLEHANLTVRDIDATIRFLRTAFPEFHIRFDGRDPDETRRSQTVIHSASGSTSTTPTATIGNSSSICRTIQHSGTTTRSPTSDARRG